jgi:hypothetical protein
LIKRASSIIKKADNATIAQCVDNILPEQLEYLGDNAIDWLEKFLKYCLHTLTIPKVWRQSRTVALLKPGKDPNLAKKLQTNISAVSNI